MEHKKVVLACAHVNIIVEEYKEYVYLSSILVHDHYKNNGYGTQALNEIVEYANTVKKPLLAWVSNELGGELNRLEKWYKKHGFYEEYNIINANYNYNYRKDFSTPF